MHTQTTICKNKRKTFRKSPKVPNKQLRKNTFNGIIPFLLTELSIYMLLSIFPVVRILHKVVIYLYRKQDLNQKNSLFAEYLLATFRLSHWAHSTFCLFLRRQSSVAFACGKFGDKFLISTNIISYQFHISYYAL